MAFAIRDAVSSLGVLSPRKILYTACSDWPVSRAIDRSERPFRSFRAFRLLGRMPPCGLDPLIMKLI